MKTIRTTLINKHELRLVLKNGIYFGLILGPDATRLKLIEGALPEEVWQRLQDELVRTSHRYFGFDGAIAYFKNFFPDGFGSDKYKKQERNYKVDAKSQLEANLPLDWAKTGDGMGERALRIYQRTNLLSPFEKVRLQDFLRGKSADEFVRAAARFALGEQTMLGAMEQLLKPHDCAKWTIITYLPFFWCPDKHMFLKPEVTRDFAERVGHRYANDYSPRLDIAVYHSLLDLAETTNTAVDALSPKDRIDIQSFIWVVGDYQLPEKADDQT